MPYNKPYKIQKEFDIWEGFSIHFDVFASFFVAFGEFLETVYHWVVSQHRTPK